MYQNGNNHQSQQPDSNHPNQEGFASDLTVDDYSRRYQKESARNGMPEGKMSDVKDGKMMSKPPVVGRLGVTHILFMCFAFLALAGIVAYLFLGGETNTPLKDTSPIAAENLTTVYFYPTTECSADELSEMTKTIAERIQVLGTAYDVSSDEKKIILKIDKTLLGNTAVERKHTVDLIASRGDLLIHANNFGSTAKLSGADIETVEVVNFDLRTFLADNVNNLEGNRYEQLEVMGADEVYGIKIIVKAESGEKCRAVLKEAAENNGKMAILHNSPSEE
ncbi:MAG: hypothetical protein IKV88_00135 [Clostridia bacterium]|nr:hypothetical protein [Clostridia bacterium]